MLEQRSEGYPVQYSWMQATKISKTLWIITASVYRYSPTDTVNTMYYTGLYLNFADKSTVSLVISASIGNTWNGNANVLKPDVSTAFELYIEDKQVKLKMARSETSHDYNTGTQFIGMIYAELRYSFSLFNDRTCAYTRTLTSFDDLDTITTSGTYAINTSSGTPSNLPISAAGTGINLRVEYNAAGDRYIQTVTYLADPVRVFMRRRGSSSWHTWSEVSNKFYDSRVKWQATGSNTIGISMMFQKNSVNNTYYSWVTPFVIDKDNLTVEITYAEIVYVESISITGFTASVSDWGISFTYTGSDSRVGNSLVFIRFKLVVKS